MPQQLLVVKYQLVMLPPHYCTRIKANNMDTSAITTIFADN